MGQKNLQNKNKKQSPDPSTPKKNRITTRLKHSHKKGVAEKILEPIRQIVMIFTV